MMTPRLHKSSVNEFKLLSEQMDVDWGLENICVRGFQFTGLCRLTSVTWIGHSRSHPVCARINFEQRSGIGEACYMPNYWG